MRKETLGVIMALGVLVGCVGAMAAPERRSDLLPNGNFETVKTNRPVGWAMQTMAGKARLVLSENGGRARSNGVTIEADDPEGCDAAWVSSIGVRPFGKYRLTAFIKTENVEKAGGQGAAIVLLGRTEKSNTFIRNSDWTQAEIVFDAGADDSIQIACALGVGGKAKGKAYFDDVRLDLVEARPMDLGSITIDGRARMPAMSPNIYSQFIEHLGRCIYGGIWAEMLEDRKFYHPITPNYAPYTKLQDTAFPVVGASPWEIIGARADFVTMSKEKPFVGRHTPVIAAGAGIRQRDLGVLKGKEYTGYIWLKSSGAAQATVALAWGDDARSAQVVTIDDIGTEYRKYPLRFVAGASTDAAVLAIRAIGAPLSVGTVSLMPADNIDGMRRDTLALLKELNGPIYRWPGGNFVSGYDFRDGLGDRDKRPPRTNPAWTGVEHNDFGTQEFIRFCRLINTEPWITVNTGFGDAHSAAAWLEYCNGSEQTPWGRRRADHGSPEPFRVKYWGVGNEMWGAWQLGYMKLDHYVIKQNWVVDVMREVDPKIVTISSGNAGTWSEGLLKNCSNHMDLIAEHFYTGEKPSVLQHIRLMNQNIKKKADFHREMRGKLENLQGKDIRVAMTEWNYWYGPHAYGELGTKYFLKDAMGIAAGLHEYARQSDIISMAFYAQTVNVIGCIKTSKTAAAFDSTGLVLKLYRQEFGTIPVKTEASPMLDVQAMVSADGKWLTIGVVNPWDQEQTVPLRIDGLRVGRLWQAWQIVGADLDSTNEPGKEPQVKIEQVRVDPGRAVKLAPQSITLIKMPLD